MLRELAEGVYFDDVVVDSDMTLQEAFRGLDPSCPDKILAAQELIGVFYWGEDKRLHRGQLVLHRTLIKDIVDAFTLLLHLKVPLHSVIPVSDERFSWSDYASMEANNSSAFNFRPIINNEVAKSENPKLSLHALGMAVDLNPAWNPSYDAPETRVPDYLARLKQPGTGKDAATHYTSKLP